MPTQLSTHWCECAYRHGEALLAWLSLFRSLIIRMWPSATSHSCVEIECEHISQTAAKNLQQRSTNRECFVHCFCELLLLRRVQTCVVMKQVSPCSQGSTMLNRPMARTARRMSAAVVSCESIAAWYSYGKGRRSCGAHRCCDTHSR